MAYDEDLAERIRTIVTTEAGITEQRMFGGLAFLHHGNLAVAASGRGGLLARVAAEDSEDLLGDGVDLMEMRGVPRRGWLFIEADVVGEDRALRAWVERSLAFVRTLPRKSGH